MIPARTGLALQADGWWVRGDQIWHKPNALPDPVDDRPTLAHEHVFLLTKRAHYAYHGKAIRELASWARWGAQRSVKRAGRGLLPKDLSLEEVRALAAAHGGTKNARSVWTIPTRSYRGPHPATFPPKLAERCVLAGSGPADVVLDPFSGSGTTLLVAARLGRRAVGIELDGDKVGESVGRLQREVRGVAVRVVPDAAARSPPPGTTGDADGADEAAGADRKGVKRARARGSGQVPPGATGAGGDGAPHPGARRPAGRRAHPGG
jgi:DNA modification methylase